MGLDVRGVVWDSCPGPRPEITVPRVAALLAVNWYCARKDGLNSTDAAVSSYRLLIDRGWPNLVRRLQGKQLELRLFRVCGQATLVGTISSCTRRWPSSSSTPTQTTTSHKSTWKVRCLKSGEGRVPDSQQPGFLGLRMCCICESTRQNTRRQSSTS